jgi:glycosyltransferase involved in cell wall biosynthesis
LEKHEPRITVAAPVFNEASLIDELVRRIRAVLDQIPGDHEIVIIDDGSSDQTVAQLELAMTKEPRLRALELSQNFGHQVAMSAALDFATGDVVALMDGDLQDAPEAIPRFLAEYHQGFDVVYAIRAKRNESAFKRICYKAFYRLAASLSDVPLPLDAGDFALLSRRVVDLMRQAPERQRYLRGLRAWCGFQQKGIPVNLESRHSGQPKYSLLKLLRLALDGIFSFSILPLRFSMLAGIATVICSSIYALYALYVKFFFPASAQAPAGFTALVLTITFLSGMQLISAGVMGEYIGRVYEEVKHRPHYIVKRTLGQTR